MIALDTNIAEFTWHLNDGYKSMCGNENRAGLTAVCRILIYGPLHARVNWSCFTVGAFLLRVSEVRSKIPHGCERGWTGAALSNMDKSHARNPSEQRESWENAYGTIPVI